MLQVNIPYEKHPWDCPSARYFSVLPVFNLAYLKITCQTPIFFYVCPPPVFISSDHNDGVLQCLRGRGVGGGGGGTSVLECFTCSVKGKIDCWVGIISELIYQQFQFSVDQSLSPSVTQSFSHSILRSISHSVPQSLYKLVNPLVKQFFLHSILQSNNSSFTQTFSQTILHSLNLSVNQFFIHSIFQSTNPSFTQSFSKSIFQSINQSDASLSKAENFGQVMRCTTKSNRLQ